MSTIFSLTSSYYPRSLVRTRLVVLMNEADEVTHHVLLRSSMHHDIKNLVKTCNLRKSSRISSSREDKALISTEDVNTVLLAHYLMFNYERFLIQVKNIYS